MATSDLHMQMIAYDYVNDRQTGGDSLARLATLIRAARTEAADAQAICLLMDNGDTLQGTPLGVHLARHAVTPHPMVAAFNTLGYDAVGIGNHDFDHGIDYLARCLAQYAAPVICSNLTSPLLPELVAHHTLTRTGTTSCGADVSLRIGFVSALPLQTASWNRHHLDEAAQVVAPLPALERAVQDARDDGAEIVIALAHMGIAQFDEGEDAQNQVIDVAGIAGVDAVIAGHTHLRFPGPDHKNTPNVDCDKGIVAGKAVVMPGSSASELGVIDLCLNRPDENSPWQVTVEHVALRSLTPGVSEEPGIVALAEKAHLDTRAHLASPVAHLATPMHSYFALACPSDVPALMAGAKSHAISKAVAGTDLADLPLLAAVATPATGGYDGPDNFIELPAGQLQQRHISNLIPYANQIWAVKATGARIAGWLERSALLFNVLQPNTPDQMLIDPHVPGFRFDAIYGLRYQIDLTQASRFDAAGRPIDGAVGRISKMEWQGQPVQPDQEFLVAVTDHRAGGGGTFRPFEDAEIVVREHAPLDAALIDYLNTSDRQTARSAAPWRFARTSGLSAVLHTAPDALNYLPDIEKMRPEPCGFTKDGFVRLRLHF